MIKLPNTANAKIGMLVIGKDDVMRMVTQVININSPRTSGPYLYWKYYYPFPEILYKVVLKTMTYNINHD